MRYFIKRKEGEKRDKFGVEFPHAGSLESMSVLELLLIDCGEIVYSSRYSFALFPLVL
jgi:hypothetical protein